MSPHAIVVGAGLAGLVAANHLIDDGWSVTVLDGAGHAGGRAHSRPMETALVNLGPHAVYDRGVLARELRRLGVPVPGRRPPTTRAMVVADGSLKSVGRLVPTAVATLARLRRRPAAGMTVTAWLDDAGVHGVGRSLALALVRTTTYTDAPDLLDARVAHDQFWLGLGGVTYVDGGWATLVDGLAARLDRRGVHLTTGAPVRRVVVEAGRATGVADADGRHTAADGVILAVGAPTRMARLLPDPHRTTLEVVAAARTPIHLATLDVVLAIPDHSHRLGTTRRGRTPGPTQAIGDGDDPRYLLVQSRVARLAPPDREVVHVARYLAPDESADAVVRADLERLLDACQPGWRDRVVEASFLPRLVVAHDLPRAAARGTDGRPPVTVAGIDGLALAGDAFGSHGILADAAVASAAAAARAVRDDLAAVERTTMVA